MGGCFIPINTKMKNFYTDTADPVLVMHGESHRQKKASFSPAIKRTSTGNPILNLPFFFADPLQY
jgi:hypothetical protein